jgi:uncharacterized protein (TIGR02246 family)
VIKNALRIVLIFAVSAVAAAQQSAPRADASPVAEDEIKALELKLADWIVHGNWDAYAQVLAPDYLHTNYSGHVENKDEALAGMRDEHREIIVMEAETADQSVRIFGDTAVFNAQFTIWVRESGQVKTRVLRVTDVFLRRDGQWSLIAEQSTATGK